MAASHFIPAIWLMVVSAQQSPWAPKPLDVSFAAPRARCAEAFISSEVIEHCVAAIRETAEVGEVARIQTKLARAHWKNGDRNAAIRAGRGAAEAEPQNALAAFELGLYLESAEGSVESHSQLRRAVTLGLRKENGALRELGVVFKADPFLGYGIVLDRLAGALRAQRTLWQSTLTSACEAYEVRKKRGVEALDCRRRLIGSDAEGHWRLGNSLLAEDLLDDSLAFYREATRLSPRTAGYHLGLATAMEKKGDIEESLASYRTALRLNPSLQAAREAVSGMESLSYGIPDAQASPQVRRERALRELRRCIDEGVAASCRRALSLGLAGRDAARALTFTGLSDEDPFFGGAVIEGGVEATYRSATRADPTYALPGRLLNPQPASVKAASVSHGLTASSRVDPELSGLLLGLCFVDCRTLWITFANGEWRVQGEARGIVIPQAQHLLPIPGTEPSPQDADPSPSPLKRSDRGAEEEEGASADQRITYEERVTFVGPRHSSASVRQGGTYSSERLVFGARDGNDASIEVFGPGAERVLRLSGPAAARDSQSDGNQRVSLRDDIFDTLSWGVARSSGAWRVFGSVRESSGRFGDFTFQFPVPLAVPSSVAGDELPLPWEKVVEAYPDAVDAFAPRELPVVFIHTDRLLICERGRNGAIGPIVGDIPLGPNERTVSINWAGRETPRWTAEFAALSR